MKTTTGKLANLQKLISELANDASGPDLQLLFDSPGFPGRKSFNDYCDEGRKMIETEGLDEDGVLTLINNTYTMSGDAQEVVLDFIRHISPASGSKQVEKIAGNHHLKSLAEASMYWGAKPNPDDRALRISRRIANRGLEIAKNASFDINPDIYGDLFIALGQSFARPQGADLKKAVDYYLQGLEYKELAKNQPDINKMHGLMREMIKHLMTDTLMKQHMGGGLGQSLDALRSAFEAAKKLRDLNLINNAGISLAEALGSVSQPHDGAQIAEELLKLDGITAEQQFTAKFVLAARLSETNNIVNVKRARSIGEDLVKQIGQGYDNVAPQTVWMNLGNFRRLELDYEGALEAFETARELCPKPKKNELQPQYGQITALLAQMEFLMGNSVDGGRHLEEAGELFSLVAGVAKLHFESMASRLYLDHGEYAKAAKHAEYGIALRRMILKEGATPDTWESMLGEWTRIDAYAIKAYMKMGSNNDKEKALLSAESVKGRLLTWLNLMRILKSDEAAKKVLSDELYESAIENAKAWCKKGRRWILSFFTHDLGTSILAIDPSGTVQGDWLDHINYKNLRQQIFDPWEEGLELAMKQNNDVLRKLSSSIIELLMSRLGTAIGQALPGLLDGGEELVIIPHRLFRSLPLSNLEFANGKRLHQCFSKVSFVPTMTTFAEILSQKSKKVANTKIKAIVDPDGSLPFARLDGILGVGLTDTIAGEKATFKMLQSGLRNSRVVLLSCHGNFDERNVWRSTISLADGNVEIGDLLKESSECLSDLVILGACEAGKSRRSLSDEPLSFPTMFEKIGAKMVIAPLWEVDDLCAHLTITRILAAVKEGIHPATALARASDSIRNLKASEVLKELSSIKSAVSKHIDKHDATTRASLEQRLSDYENWISHDFEFDELPFDELDCSAFQIFGYTPHSN